MPSVLFTTYLTTSQQKMGQNQAKPFALFNNVSKIVSWNAQGMNQTSRKSPYDGSHK